MQAVVSKGIERARGLVECGSVECDFRIRYPGGSRTRTSLYAAAVQVAYAVVHGDDGIAISLESNRGSIQRRRVVNADAAMVG